MEKVNQPSTELINELCYFVSLQRIQRLHAAEKITTEQLCKINSLLAERYMVLPYTV